MLSKGLLFLIAATAFAQPPLKLERVDSIMVAVKDLDAAKARHSAVFGSEFYDLDATGLKVWGVGAAAMDATGFQLWQASSGDAAKFVERSGEAIVGLSLKVPDLSEAMAAMKARQIRLLGEGAFGPVRYALYDPAATFGVLLQLVEYRAGYTVAELDLALRWRETRKLPPPSYAKPKVQVVTLDHFLIYVADINAARTFLGNLLGSDFPAAHQSAATASLLSIDGWGIELVASNNPKSDVSRFLERRGPGMGAISLKVANFAESSAVIEELQGKASATRDLPTRRVGLYGRGKFGFGIELIDYRPLAHPAVAAGMRQQLMTAGGNAR